MPGTGLDVYMVVPDNSPNRSGDYCTRFINETMGSKMPRDLPKVSELGFKLLAWLQPRLFPPIILNCFHKTGRLSLGPLSPAASKS